MAVAKPLDIPVVFALCNFSTTIRELFPRPTTWWSRRSSPAGLLDEMGLAVISSAGRRTGDGCYGLTLTLSRRARGPRG